MLELVVPVDALQALPTAESCLRIIEEEGVDTSKLRLYDKPLVMKRLRGMLRRRASFLIKGDGVMLDYSAVGNYNHSIVVIEGLQEQRAWGSIAQIVSGAPLVSARLYESDYERWQNAEDPLEFSDEGRSMEGLPMKDNGLPPPLNRTIVDVSRNPGRRVLRDGYVEAIGHRMWLGLEFFRRVPGVSREAVSRCAWLKVTERPGSILELEVSREPFVDESTAGLQDRLRALLFPAVKRSSDP